MLDFKKITLAVVNSREDYINECLGSLNRIVYPTMNELIDIKIFNNYKNKDIKKQVGQKINIRSIGGAFNRLVKKAEGDWIMFVGDDDMIARSLPFVYSLYLITYEEKHPKDYEDVVCVTGNMILFDSMGKREPLQSCPTGMWKKSFLLENPFNEEMDRYVDTEMFARTLSLNKKILYAATDYSYYYRQHSGNVSGNKFDEKSNLLKEIEKRNKRQKDLGGV